MKALNMSMASAALQATKNRVRNMHDLCGGVGSKLLTPAQIDKLLKQKQADKERRAWEKVLGIGKTDPRKSKGKRPAKPSQPVNKSKIIHTKGRPNTTKGATK
jgi:hypothetical protein